MKAQTIVAVNRFGLGARPGDLARVDGNHREWLLQQLEGPQVMPAMLRELPASTSILTEVEALRQAMRAARKNPAMAADSDAVKSYGKLVREHYLAQVHARYVNAAQTDYPFYERLVHFWSNHFAISADKQPLPAIAGAIETEAIRPHVGSRFFDMLRAVEQHPAMLLYLDNRNSVGPNSPFGRRARRRAGSRIKGLNENLAREILELHTLGVDGGYSQQDVTSFAKIITGWSLGDNDVPADAGSFVFRKAMHEPGAHTVLGKRYDQAGVRQGEAVLQDLALHPATARHLSTKLARHFLSDDPPPALVERMTRVYLKSDGDLDALYTALIDGIESTKQITEKYKSPHDFVISSLRAMEEVPVHAVWTVNALDLLGQRPFQPGSPAGWPDTADHWGGADALYKRIEWAGKFVRQVAGERNPVSLGDAILGRGFSKGSRRIVSRAESVNQGLTLLLASPDFQRR